MVLLKQIIRKTFHYRPSSCGLRFNQGQIRCLAKNSGFETNYFITTPIFYVNSAPHIGHVYTAVLADALSRWQRLHSKTVAFTTGTDEHGLKIQQAASNGNKEPLTFCNEISNKFQDVFKLANISHTDFVRTTEERHKLAVTEFWKTLESKNHIYKGKYERWYSTSDETFLTEGQVIDSADEGGSKIKVSLESGQPVEWMEEENYLFRLRNFKEDLRNWINTGVIKPAKFADVALSMINDDLPDLSISRQRDRLQWGIPVPNDDSQTIYVWLDALVNYLTAAGYPGNMSYWPPDCQVIGKDIIRFHAIYWPAFLMAVGLDLPKSLFVHSHWTVDNMKMSKSRGNVVDPVQKLQDFGPDEVKFVLLREGVPHSDCNYSDYKIAEWVVCDLANAFGNLLSHCTTEKLNPYQLCPVFKKNVFEKMATKDDRKFLDQLKAVPGKVHGHFEDYNIYKAIAAITEQLRETHGFFTRHEPWKMKFNKIDHLNCVLSVTMENLRICGILMQPMMPSLAGKLLDRLAIPVNKRKYIDAEEMFPNSEDVKLGPNPGPLIPPKSYSHSVFAEECQKKSNTK